MPLQPRYLDYDNTQILLIGHKEHALEKAADQQSQDEGKGKDQPIDEMEKLEHEDEIRVEHLKGTSVVKMTIREPQTDHSQAMTRSL